MKTTIVLSLNEGVTVADALKDLANEIRLSTDKELNNPLRMGTRTCYDVRIETDIDA